MAVEVTPGATATPQRDGQAAQQWVYMAEDAPATNRDLLGGKGAGLAAMTQAGLPVPAAFTITTAACNAFQQQGGQFPAGLWDQTLAALKKIEQKSGRKLGDAANPLLVSVRSGARESMPGMMDTVLNLGLNDETVQGLARQTNNERFAWDAYRRFVGMFGRIVLNVPGEKIDGTFEDAKRAAGARQDTDLTADNLRAVTQQLKTLVEKETGQPFPTDVLKQLELAIKAVFNSWMGKRAVDYRNQFKIPHDLGTAVSVVTMVFGNMGDDSGTGVAFTRDPSTGKKEIYGEFLANAQGEDVVAGIRTPMSISKMREVWPDVYRQFEQIADRLEQTYKDVQDLEFTVERGKLYMLQTRNAKRTGKAAVVTAVDMVGEGVITKEEALKRIQPMHVQQMMVPQFDPVARRKSGAAIGKGLAASPGAAVGKVVFDPDRAAALAATGEPVVLARKETSPEDFHGMAPAVGILTSRGGSSSHAAVVARQMGKPCIAGAEEIDIDVDGRRLTANGVTLREGDWISLDGTTGEVFAGRMGTVEPDVNRETELITLLSWADETRRLGVKANADTPPEATRARQLGAEGIGLCRTEHMFREEGRPPIVQTMILAAPEAKRGDTRARGEYVGALDKLEEFQTGDFYGILEAMDGLPVIIRLIDPPLHEFLPRHDRLLVEVTEARTRGQSGPEVEDKERLLRAVEALHEQNPMLGLRGCRLGILFPEIVEMQVRAIARAASKLKQAGKNPQPQIMIPLVGTREEMALERERLEKVVKDVFASDGVEVAYKIGTMIEVPRACLVADRLAETAEFFSFGTNDLTQMTFGYSRDDAEGKFLGQYLADKILPFNPFESIDPDGVGKLMSMGLELGKRQRPDLEVGICGEHGGDPASVALCHELGLDYVSCAPGRIPVARSRESPDRDYPEDPDPMRTAYQIDRDRIIHSKAFRRLKHKTQVFIAPVGDHYRTRLTHTMEVMQVARSIARGLNLNEDLTEAIALGHDLGHTPFGHAGEYALGACLPGGFRHNEQSVRVVELLEKDGRGLNLTREVRDGILRHSKLRESIAAEGWGIASTLEGQIVKVADSLAYLNHDIDDAIRAGVISIDALPRRANELFGTTSGSRITAFVTDVVDYNWSVALGEGNTWKDAVGNGIAVGMSPEVLEIVDELREFMFSNVYTDSAAKEDDPKTHFIVHKLFEYLCQHPDDLPEEWRANPRDEPIERRVADYIAGMTDRYAIQVFERFYVPGPWAVLS